MSRRARVVGTLLVGLLATPATAVWAQTTPVPGATTTVARATTTTAVPGATTTTVAPSTTTTAKPKVVVTAPTTTTTTTTTTTPPLKSSVGAGAAAAYVDSLARSGANNTGALLDALKAYETLGFSHEEAVKQGFGHFPVGGYASFRDDFGDPRAGPPVHTHGGNDIFAAFNTPIRAPMDGLVRFGSDPLGGLHVYLTTADGTFFYICHLNGYPTDVTSGTTVTQGTVIGLVGDTGDAKGNSPHAHFEIHPKGGGPVNPKPFLDAWLSEALANVPKLVGATVLDQPPVLQATGATRRFDVRELDRRPQAPVEPLLWASSVSPTGSALRLAEAEVARLAGSIDWAGQTAQAQAAADARRRADDNARAVLWRLTPPVLAAVVGGAPRG